MTLSVSAIRNYSPVNYNRNNLQTKEALKAQPSFEGNHKSNSMRKVAYVMIGGMMVPVLTSCDKEGWWGSYSKSETESNSEAYCDCDSTKKNHGCGGNGSVNNDSTINNGYESPVMDSIRSIIGILGGDTTTGRKVVKVSYVDELDTRFNEWNLDEKSSNADLVVAKRTKSTFNDSLGIWDVTSPLNNERWEFRLTNNDNLYGCRWVAKDGIKNPIYPIHYTKDNDLYWFTGDQANKIVNVFDGNGESILTLQSVEDGRIRATLESGTDFNLTNFDSNSK